jgi:membrane protease YdiL (CAAX protease family)
MTDMCGDPGATEQPAWRRGLRARPVAAFLLLTFLYSWGVWWLARIVLPDASWGFRISVHTAGLCGPTVAAVVLSGLIGGRRGIGDLLGRIALWRVGLPWYLFSVGSTLAVGLTAIGLHALGGGETPPMNSQIVLAQALSAGLPEEYGWRGFALPYLLRKHGALASSVVIAVFWVVWHLPVSPALSHPVVLCLFLLEVIPLSTLFSWLYINSRGSILLVVLYHLACNAVVEVLNIPGSPSLWVVYVGLMWLLAAVVVARHGAARLTRPPRRESPATQPPGEECH